MAKGLRIGVRVKAKATKILGARGATQEFGKQTSKAEMRSEIVRKEGAGPATKWVARWDKPPSESVWNTRSLTRDDAAEEGPGESTTSNDDKSSDSDEAPDVVEHVAPADDPVAEPVAAAAVENLLVVDGIVWTPSDIITADHFDGNYHSMRILWGDDLPVITKSVYHFFLVMFPTQKLRDFASWTSLTLVDVGQMAITPQELLKVIGLLYGMTVQQHGEHRSYWRVVEGEGEESLFPAPAWGTHFGMGQRRFETVLRYLTLHDPTCVDEGDRWHPVRTLVDAFNERRLDKIHPSGSLVVDESFGSWVSQKPDHMPDALPHTQKIMRKPNGVGTEFKNLSDGVTGVMMRLEIQEKKFKNLADGVTGVMMRLEIQEKKADMADKDWSALSAGTAWLLRLCEPYYGTHRIIRADSAFTSTTAAVELGKRGLFLQGIVKGATKEYPAKYLLHFSMKRVITMLQHQPLKESRC